MRRLMLVAAFVLGAWSSPALAEEPTGQATGQGSSPSNDLWKEPSGRGVSFGIGNGIFGSHLLGQDLRLKFPFSDHLAAQVRGLIVHRVDQGDALYRLDMGVRLGIIGYTSPMLNILRVYGGGGVQMLAGIDAPDGEEKGAKFGLSGEFGLEAFLVSSMSFFIEVGAGGFFDTPHGHGGSAMAGMNFYPF